MCAPSLENPLRVWKGTRFRRPSKRPSHQPTRTNQTTRAGVETGYWRRSSQPGGEYGLTRSKNGFFSPDASFASTLSLPGGSCPRVDVQIPRR